MASDGGGVFYRGRYPRRATRHLHRAEGGGSAGVMRAAAREPKIPLGTYWTWFIRRTLHLPLNAARVHMHVLGKTGSGKSYFLASLFLSLFLAGQPVTLIDPHGDLAQLVLAHLVQRGQLRT